IAKPEDSLTIGGRIFLVENLGMQNLISVQVNGSDTRIRALLPSHQAWEGEDITLSFSPQAIHWFDVQSGDRISTHNPGEAGRLRQPLDLDNPNNGASTTTPRRFTNT
ncbi:MAG TPA: TOBE domain-containing protein, partial [Allocoleopsis sp.]